jgi:hypothetical protein
MKSRDPKEISTIDRILGVLSIIDQDTMEGYSKYNSQRPRVKGAHPYQ